MDEPVTTSVEVVKQIAPSDLTSHLSDDTISALIDNAAMIALGDQFPKVVKLDDGEIIPARDTATRYMALHLLYVSNSKAGQGVTSEQVDVLKRTYADTANIDWYNSSPWGKLYLHWYKLYGGGSGSRYGVYQH